MSVSKKTAETIKNCFRHAGFVKEDVSGEENVEIEPEFFPPENLVEEAQQRGVIPEDISLEDYISINDEVLKSENITDDQIVNSVLSRKNEAEDEEKSESDSDVEESETKIPTLSEASAAMDTLQRFLLGQENSLAIMENLDKIEDFCKSCSDKNRKQKSYY